MSPLVGPGTVATSLIVLALLYLVLAVVEVGLLVRYAKAGPPAAEDARPSARIVEDEHAPPPLTFAY